MSRASPRLVAEIRAEATEWLISFSEGEIDARAREGFNAWLRTSPEHVRTYLQIAAFWQEAHRIEHPGHRDIDALVEWARTEANVISFASAPERAPPRVLPTRPQHATPLRVAAIAAAVVLCFAGAWLLSQHGVYTTGVGEHRTITLADGSTVILNAASAIRVRFTATQRGIELTKGQALFHVEKDAARPFVVSSDTTHVQAVGTQFDVDKRRDGTIVTVIEGRVAVKRDETGAAVVAQPDAAGARASPAVAPLILSAGEQAVVIRAAIQKRRPANPTAATAWNQGLLVFDSASLSEVVQEFNRQNLKPLIIEDAMLAELRISGIFPATGSARLTEFLRTRFGVVVTETDAGIRLSRP